MFEKEGTSPGLKDPLSLVAIGRNEREKDVQLCAAINQRRKAVTDKGYRFAVVLVTKAVQMGEHTLILSTRLEY